MICSTKNIHSDFFSDFFTVLVDGVMDGGKAADYASHFGHSYLYYFKQDGEHFEMSKDPHEGWIARPIFMECDPSNNVADVVATMLRLLRESRGDQSDHLYDDSPFSRKFTTI